MCVFIKTLCYPLFLTLLVDSILFANQVNNKGGSSGASGPTKSPTSISSKEVQDRQSVVHADKTQIESIKQNVRKHPLAPPTNFLKDGVYVWCDPDGLWTLFLKVKKNVDLSVKLTSKTPVTIKRKTDNLNINIITEDPNSIYLQSKSNTNKAIAQFASVSAEINFDILIDNVNDPNDIYIGHLYKKPNKQIFSLSDNLLIKQVKKKYSYFESPKNISKSKRNNHIQQVPFGGYRNTTSATNNTFNNGPTRQEK